MRLKRGIYWTRYGNIAYVWGPKAKTAYDLDSDERIPIALISSWHSPVRYCDRVILATQTNRTYTTTSYRYDREQAERFNRENPPCQ